jgi:hypothetical protein
MGWKQHQLDNNMQTNKMQMDTPSIVNCEGSVKKVEGNFDDFTLTNSLENLVSMGNSSTKVSRTSKRPKRPQLTMTNDFLW